MKHRPPRHTLTFLSLVLGVVVFVLIVLSAYLSGAFTSVAAGGNSDSTFINQPTSSPTDLDLSGIIIVHKKTPEVVKAVYMTSWMTASTSTREKLLTKIAGTEINAIMLDVKDPDGKIVIKLNAPSLSRYNSEENRVKDIVEFVDELHQKGYYVIGHISVFQDNYLTRIRPDLAMRRKDNNEIWADKKGMAWLDVSQQEVWDYVIDVAREAYATGFDELNFDFVRFPTDGDLSQIRYRNFDPTKETRAQALQKFFVYLHDHLQDIGAPTSADLFGMTTTNTDDLGIGQVLENIAPYVDYVAPMIYPSQYPAGWMGLKKPVKEPYKVVKISLESAAKRLETQGLSKDKLRPWLQDFSIGTVYNSKMVKQELKGVYDAGLKSWMMWDASNRYTMSAYQKSPAK